MISTDLNKLECKLGRTMDGLVLFLYDIARKMRGVKTILEIGVRQGTSTNSFLLGIADRKYKERTHLYSIDIDDETYAVDKFLGKEKFDTLRKYWTFIVGDSKKVRWDKEIDVLLIDGDHTYQGVKSDYEKYAPFVRKGGLILIHDAHNHRPVRKFWKELKVPKVALPMSRAGLGVIEKQ